MCKLAKQLTMNHLYYNDTVSLFILSKLKLKRKLFLPGTNFV